MKLVKKRMAMVLAILMLLILCVPAYASTGPVVGDGLTDHTFKAYQIFTGTQAVDDPRLAEIEWGDGIDGTKFLAALQASKNFGEVSPFAECSTARDVAKAVNAQNWDDDSQGARAFAKLAYDSIVQDSGKEIQAGDVLEAGYYLIVDVTVFDPNDVNTIYNLALLQLTQEGTFDINPKVSVPEVSKKVKDFNDTTRVESDWQDYADYDIGDDVPFMLTAQLTEIEDYETYKIVFHDTLSKGLTYNAGSIVVKLYKSGEDSTGTPLAEDSDYTVAIDGNNLTVTIDDVKSCGAGNNSRITVEYTAKLNENAVIGDPGNPNEVYLEYSNNPNESGKGDDSTGKTPKDVVVVFTFKLVVNKVDDSDKHNALVGATFELFKKTDPSSDTYTSVKKIVGTNQSTFEWTGIDSGEYKLCEEKAPDGYNKIDDIYFTVTAEYSADPEGPTLQSLSVKGPEPNVFQELNGTLTATVVNEGGIVLPETGGIGTTIFYVLGAALLVGASVILLVRKRMNG